MTALLQHWQLKVAALAVATALWVFVTTSEKAEVVVAAPLEIDAVPPGVQVVGERPDSVDVQLHGLRAILGRLGPDQVRARVSLAGVRPGEVVLRVLPEQIVVPAGVTVLRVSPSRVRFVVEASRSSRLTVVPRLTGSLHDGYRVVGVSVTPADVQVEGPASQVNGLTEIATEPVNLSGATATIERMVALAAPAGSIRIVGERRVRVVVEVTGAGTRNGDSTGGRSTLPGRERT